MARDGLVTLVDSNVLLDLATDDPPWGAWCAHALSKALDEGPVGLNPIGYAEVSACCQRAWKNLDAFVPETVFRASVPSGIRSGERDAPLPDFCIGAHAAGKGYRLLTREAARYRTCFPQLGLLSPLENCWRA